ncbi:MAG: family 31 glucosidase [Treponemataceae bacterium]|nr:family 31 glucosidase [Treponemataceae bacterium]
MFIEENGALILKKGYETLKIEPWGTDSLRVRATVEPDFTGNVWGLTEKVAPCNAKIQIAENGASIANGKAKICISNNGILTLYKEDKLVLREYHRHYDTSATKESVCLKIVNREYKGLTGGDYKFTLRFYGNDGEKLYGMGTYQMPYLDMKGCTLELCQRNSQISIPFALSSLGYGFLWNNPATGRAVFGKNITEWVADSTKEMDYWFTCADTPAEIVRNYTSVVGRAPVLTKDYLGFWQCKLRYRTQEEILDVARRYKAMGIHLDVIVIDFFHWMRQGDWAFDPEYWPDPKAMCDELHEMGTKVMVSVWPSVDKKCNNFYAMKEQGLLVRTDRGSDETYDYNGDCITFDATNPAARKFVWDVCKKNYADYGIDMFWLDNSEPDYAAYDFNNLRYYLGPGTSCSNIYPRYYGQAFYEGMKEMGRKNFVNLERCTWVGGQKNATVIWNGDIQSTFECLEDSVCQGLSMGLAGIPWWTTDIGGFMGGNTDDPEFIELLERWFEFAVFSPIFRLHGERVPHDVPNLAEGIDYGGGFMFTGRPNEIWSYGEEAQKIMEKNIRLRESLVPYIEGVMKEASETGAPAMRTMFFEFPEDCTCWDLKDQYMFGSEYLVAPILHLGEKSRKVYLPQIDGMWTNIHTGEKTAGGQWITAEAPIDQIPVFKR